MSKVQEGDHITVVYEGILDNGEIFESSKDTGPLKFTVGLGTVMDSFEKNVIGMEIGETREIKVSPEDGFGEHKPELVQTIDKSSLGDGIEAQVGMVLGMTVEKDGESHKVPAMVVKIVGNEVTVDYNHPLAGKGLIYKITLQEIGIPPQLSLGDQGNDGGCGCH